MVLLWFYRDDLGSLVFLVFSMVLLCFHCVGVRADPIVSEIFVFFVFFEFPRWFCYGLTRMIWVLWFFWFSLWFCYAFTVWVYQVPLLRKGKVWGERERERCREIESFMIKPKIVRNQRFR